MSYTWEHDGCPHGGSIHDEEGLEIADHVSPAIGPLLAAAPNLLARARDLVETMEVPRTIKGGRAYFALWDLISEVEATL